MLRRLAGTLFAALCLAMLASVVIASCNADPDRDADAGSHPHPKADRDTPPTQIPGRADLYEAMEVPEHLVYVWWDWDRAYGIDEVAVDFTIHSDPGDFSDTWGLYLMVGAGNVGNVESQFYFGLQTDVYDPALGRGRGKGLIFSRWGTRDLDDAKLACEAECWAQESGHEGDFVGVRRAYDWDDGEYRMRMAADGRDAGGVWYSVWITDIDAGETLRVGSLRFPLGDHGPTVLWPTLYSTLEIYGYRSIRPIDIPEWHVSMERPRGDGVEAPDAKLGYAAFGEPVSNSDIQYHDGRVHLRIGWLGARH